MYDYHMDEEEKAELARRLAKLRAYYSKEVDLFRSMNVREDEIDELLITLDDSDSSPIAEAGSDFPFYCPVVLRSWSRLATGTILGAEGQARALEADRPPASPGQGEIDSSEAEAVYREDSRPLRISRLTWVKPVVSTDLVAAVNPVSGCETLMLSLRECSENPELRAITIPANPAVGCEVPVFRIVLTPRASTVEYFADLLVGEELLPASIVRKLHRFWIGCRCPTLLVASGWMKAGDVIPGYAELLRYVEGAKRVLEAARNCDRYDTIDEAQVSRALDDAWSRMTPPTPALTNAGLPDKELVELALRLLSPQAYHAQILLFLEDWQLALERLIKKERSVVFGAVSTVRLMGILARLRASCRQRFRY